MSLSSSPKQPKVSYGISVLQKESNRPFNDLVATGEALGQSPDTAMQYAGAWSLLYASGKDHPDASEAFDSAIEQLETISVNPVVRKYAWTSSDIPLRASFALALAPQIREPKKILTADERVAVYRLLGPVLERGIAETETGSTNSLGALGEIAIAALCWRPYPEVLSVLNVIPSGPAQDSRYGRLTKYATDLYAYHPTVRSTKKGRVNLQIKTTATRSNSRKYDSKMVVVFGLNEVASHSALDLTTGTEACLWLSKTIIKDMAGEPLDIHDQEPLLYTAADL